MASALLRILAPAFVLLVAGCGRGGERLVSLPEDHSGSLVIRNVRVFDAPRARLSDGMMDVLVREGRIEKISECGLDSGGAPELDGGGGTLLPGLVDTHTHTGSSSNPPGATGSLPDLDANLAAFLYAGVTTVLDLGSLAPAIFEQRDEIARGERLGPRVFAAGPVFTAHGGHPAEVLREWLPWYLRWYVLPRATREIAGAQDAHEAVAELLEHRPDILKITIDVGAAGDVPNLSQEALAGIIEAGHASGIRSIVHIGDSAEALAAVRAGADALAHSPWRDELSEETVAALAHEPTPVVATIAGWDLGGRPRTKIEDFLPIEREVASDELVELLLATPARPEAKVFMKAASDAWEIRRRNVGKLMAAGVPVLAGSDAANPGNIPGAGLHLEMRKLVEAGMSPGQALRAATYDNARFLSGRDANFGEIDAGKRADLVLVDGDPTARIEDTEKIREVILAGRPLLRKKQGSDKKGSGTENQGASP
ncbi:MAG TPA: amidohydrolase family protein [Candidatus Binatia bacterium]|nr:amidohydrolase family protein [Candidatus Binatia bacterium]